MYGCTQILNQYFFMYPNGLIPFFIPPAVSLTPSLSQPKSFIALNNSINICTKYILFLILLIQYFVLLCCFTSFMHQHHQLTFYVCVCIFLCMYHHLPSACRSQETLITGRCSFSVTSRCSGANFGPVGARVLGTRSCVSEQFTGRSQHVSTMMEVMLDLDVCGKKTT